MKRLEGKVLEAGWMAYLSPLEDGWIACMSSSFPFLIPPHETAQALGSCKTPRDTRDCKRCLL